MNPLSGIHHVTAITGDAQRNLDFYSGVLGLRLVKKTVNFDDPGSYHLYYGDRIGAPGTLITFFAWPGAAQTVTAAGEPVAMALAVPPDSLPWWEQRFLSAGLTIQESGERFGSSFISVNDPDGIRIELITSTDKAEVQHWPASGIPEENAIRKIHSITLRMRDLTRSSALYTGVLTFSEAGSEGNRSRFSVGNGDSFVDVVSSSDRLKGRGGAGTIHHVAFRTVDAKSQLEWLEALIQAGLSVSPVMDRSYFHSIYFREWGGVLFEIATDGPGMAVDEPEQSLGERLQLPRQYEPLRTRLERELPALTSPQHSNA